MHPQVEVIKKGKSYLVVLKTPEKTYVWRGLSEFSLNILRGLILQKYPRAVFLHKTAPAIGLKSD